MLPYHHAPTASCRTHDTVKAGEMAFEGGLEGLGGDGHRTKLKVMFKPKPNTEEILLNHKEPERSWPPGAFQLRRRKDLNEIRVRSSLLRNGQVVWPCLAFFRPDECHLRASVGSPHSLPSDQPSVPDPNVLSV